MAFNEVFNAAMGGIPGNASNLPGSPGNTGSAWPILAFLSFIITAPYLISKLVGKVMTTAVDECKYRISDIHCTMRKLVGKSTINRTFLRF